MISANADGSDLWPCLDLYQGGPGSNPDCPTLGIPSVPFPLGALVTGFPAYSWPLENTPGAGNGFGCDALSNGTTGALAAQYNPCGQIFTSYEDDTSDFTDDLLQRIVVTQAGAVIYDSGLVDFGPAGPSVTYPVSVFLTYDTNFGFWPGDEHWTEQRKLQSQFQLPAYLTGESRCGVRSRSRQDLSGARSRSGNVYHVYRARHTCLYESDRIGVHVAGSRQPLLYGRMVQKICDSAKLEHLPEVIAFAGTAEAAPREPPGNSFDPKAQHHLKPSKELFNVYFSNRASCS